MVDTPDHYILIMCGGSGPRLWPRSRANFPKQFLPIFGSKSVFQQTVDRFISFLPASRIFIITQRKYQNEIIAQIGRTIPQKQIILEPEKRNTAMAMAYGASIISRLAPGAVISAIPSDHHITGLAAFKKQLLLSGELARATQSLITIGIQPDFPNPGFGYILPGTKYASYSIVARFIEKPSIPEAKILIQKKALWNSGIYTFTPSTLLTEFQHHSPRHYRLLSRLLKNTISPTRAYHLSPKTAIDKAVSELSSNLIVISGTFTWSDVGEWNSIYNLLAPNQNDIVPLDPRQKFLQLDSRRCLISSDTKKLIGLVGVSNLAIIDTNDAILVCSLAQGATYQVRDLVRQMVKDSKLKKYFLSRNDR